MARRLILKEGGLTGSVPSGYRGLGFDENGTISILAGQNISYVSGGGTGSGTSGVNGTSGTSGNNGVSGNNGTSGSSGTSGNNGQNGSSGTSGANGTSGSSGTSGSGSYLKITQLLDNVIATTRTGQTIVTEWTTTYTSQSGSTLLFDISFTSYSNASALRTFDILIDSVVVKSISVYFNEANSHKVISTVTAEQLSSGSHTIQIRIPAGAVVDAADYATMVVTETMSGNSGTSGTSGSSFTIQNNVDNRVLTSTGTANEANAEANLTFDGSILSAPYLKSTNSSGNEGGEINLALSQNSGLTGSNVVVDVYQNKLRIFESGGNNRGGYFDITTLGNAVSTELGKPTYFIEAYANVAYTLPGSYTEDVCRYSVIGSTSSVPNSWFNTSTYRFTPQKAGYWQITANYDVYRGAEANLILRKNGSNVALQGALNSVICNISKVIYLNGSTDYVDVINNGASANARTQNQTNAWIQAILIG